MNLSWYVRRLSRMSAPEIAMRGRDSVVKLMWRREWMREMNATRAALAVMPGAFRTTLSPELAVNEEARHRLIAAADQLIKDASFLVLPSECYENFPVTKIGRAHV